MKQLFSIPASILFVISLAAIASESASNELLEINNAWIREAPPNASVLAGFMTIHNSSATAVSITNITSPDFKRVEIHRSVVENGIAKMLPQSKLLVPASGTITLEPGSYHLMLFKPARPMKANDKTSLILKLESGKTQLTGLIIRKGSGAIDPHLNH